MAPELTLEFIRFEHARRVRVTCNDPKIVVEDETVSSAVRLAEAAIAEVLSEDFIRHVQAETGRPGRSLANHPHCAFVPAASRAGHHSDNHLL
jgi:hypothetical protein